MKKAYFAAGCFWCITPAFYDLPGVRKVTAGYSGGEEEHPSYQQVKHQLTGHRETICIDYNDTVTSFSELMKVLLCNVDPFDDGGQFIDRGRSYTLAVYYTDETECKIAAAAVKGLEESAGKTVAVSLEPFRSFWTAEEYHQDFYRTHPAEFAKEQEESGRNDFLRK